MCYNIVNGLMFISNIHKILQYFWNKTVHVSSICHWNVPNIFYVVPNRDFRNISWNMNVIFEYSNGSNLGMYIECLCQLGQIEELEPTSVKDDAKGWGTRVRNSFEPHMSNDVDRLGEEDIIDEIRCKRGRRFVFQI